MPAAPSAFSQDNVLSASDRPVGIRPVENRPRITGADVSTLRPESLSRLLFGLKGDLSGPEKYTLMDGGTPRDFYTIKDAAPEDAAPGPQANPPPKNGTGKSYLVPALEIPAFILILNGFDRLALPDKEQEGEKVYSTTPETFWDHLTQGPWVFDQDSFQVNQLGHPYQGSIYYGFARSSGLSYWESLGYTFAGSILWELGGETTDPSINDQIASGIGGTFLGEPLFRMASLLLEGHPHPGFWRQLGAAAIAPSAGLNHLLFGDRYNTICASHDPALYWRVRFSATLNTSIKGQGADEIERSFAAADYLIDYGLPGKPGYRYLRPFDYFRFELATVAKEGNLVENIMTSGLLWGTAYGFGSDYRGIWGLYGSYDYISPHIFRVSSTALSLGTTAQWWRSGNVALQGSALAGIGYGAGGNVTAQGERDYHYGAIPQSMLSLRLILGEIAMFELTGREYYIVAPGSTQPPGSELIGRYGASLLFRIFGPHALGLQYQGSLRDVFYSDAPDIHQRLDAVSITYSYQSDTTFGVVDRSGPR